MNTYSCLNLDHICKNCLIKESGTSFNRVRALARVPSGSFNSLCKINSLYSFKSFGAFDPHKPRLAMLQTLKTTFTGH